LDRGLPKTPTSSVCESVTGVFCSAGRRRTHTQDHGRLVNLPPLPKVMGLKPSTYHASVHVAAQAQLQPNARPLHDLLPYPFTHMDNMSDPIRPPTQQHIQLSIAGRALGLGEMQRHAEPRDTSRLLEDGAQRRVDRDSRVSAEVDADHAAVNKLLRQLYDARCLRGCVPAVDLPPALVLDMAGQNPTTPPLPTNTNTTPPPLSPTVPPPKQREKHRTGTKPTDKINPVLNPPPSPVAPPPPPLSNSATASKITPT
jgi:hypothetical protein